MKEYTPLKSFIIFIVLAALLGCTDSQTIKQTSHDSELPVLTAVRFNENSLIIQSNKQFTYTLNKTADPYRITVEIPDMNAGAFTEKIVPDNGFFSEVHPRQIDSPTRKTMLEIVLQSPLSLIPQYRDNSLVISVRKSEPVIMSEAKNPEPVANPVVRLVAAQAPVQKDSAAVMAKASEINSITVNKTADTVKVVISGNGSMLPNVFPVNERIVVDIPDVVLSAAIPSQAVSPLKGIRAGKHKDKLRIVLDLNEKTNFDVSAIGKAIEISLMSKEDLPRRTASTATAEPAAGAPAAAMEPAAAPKEPAVLDPLTEGVFTGKKISLDFQDADIVPIFRLLGDVSGYNVVVNPQVSGKITLKLINVPWDQALDIIMRTFSLSKVVEGNIIRILPTSAVAKELEDLKNTKKAQDEAGDLITKIFPVNYAELSKLKDAIDKAKLMSSRGSLSLDERGSSIIVNDLEANIAKIDALIKEIDQEHMQARQVMIEAKIVEVTSTYTKDLGIQWGAFYTNSSGHGTTTIGSAAGASTSARPIANLVNLPAAATSGIGFGFINRAGTFALDLKLSAMEQLLKGKVVSNPKIVTMNNQEAEITQGSTILIPVATSDQTDVKPIDAKLALKVKPRIAPGGTIFMDLDISKDQPGPLVGNNVSILKNTAKTSVLVNNEDTIVIGGIFKKSENTTDEDVPGLSKLPLIGRLLFNREKTVNDDTEILIFVTPRIIDFNRLR